MGAHSGDMTPNATLVTQVLTRLDGSPPRILVVDDEPNIAELLTMALHSEGWEISVAGTGTQAVALAEKVRPDALVLDMMLPDFDGMEVLRRVRRVLPGVPILFLSARDSVEDRVAGMTAGGDDYLTKPFSLEEVVARIRMHLGRGDRPRTGGLIMRRFLPTSLTARVAVAVVLLMAVVSLVISGLTTAAISSYLTRQLDTKVAASHGRAIGVLNKGVAQQPKPPPDIDNAHGQDAGTVTVYRTDSSANGNVITADGELDPLSDAGPRRARDHPGRWRERDRRAARRWASTGSTRRRSAVPRSSPACPPRTSTTRSTA